MSFMRSAGLVWNKLFDLGMFWKVEFSPLLSFGPLPFDVLIRCELTSLLLTGVMMFP